MSWLDRMMGRAEAVLRDAPSQGSVAPQDERKAEAVPELPPTPSAHEAALAKARRDVRRFGVAIEQCQKGEARLRVLRDDLTRAERRLALLETLSGPGPATSGEKI